MLKQAGQRCSPGTQRFPGSSGQAGSSQPQDRCEEWLVGGSTRCGWSGSSGPEALGKRSGIGLVGLLLPSGQLGHRFLKLDVSELRPPVGASRGYWLCWEEISLKQIGSKDLFNHDELACESEWKSILHIYIYMHMYYTQDKLYKCNVDIYLPHSHQNKWE